MSEKRASYRALISNRTARRSAASLVALAAAAAVGGLTSSASAIDWVGPVATPAAWENAANWSPAQVPTTSDNALVNNGGIATLADATLGYGADFLYVGSNGGTGTVQQSAGTLTLADDLQIGGDTIAPSTGTGTFTLSGGELRPAFDVMVGGGGNGTMNISSGLVQVGRHFRTAWRDNTTANINMTGGSIVATASGAGQLWLSEGNVGANTTFTMSGASSIAANDIAIGSHGSAHFVMNGGTITSASHIRLGDNADFPSNGAFRSDGTLTMTGGTINNDSAGGGNHWLVGHIGRGTINISGGSITTDRMNLGQHGANVYPAANTADHSRGILNLSGTGVVNIDTAMVIGEVSLNDNQVNVSGGTLSLRNTTSNNVTIFAGSSGGRGTLNVNGGVVNIDSHIFAGNGATAIGILNFSGGTVEMGRNLPSGGFLVLGEFGKGTMTISGGATVISDFAQTGRRANNISQGVITHTGGTYTVNNDIHLGQLSNTANSYDITGGTLSVGGTLTNAQRSGDPALGTPVVASSRLTIDGAGAAVNVVGALTNSGGWTQTATTSANVGQTIPGGNGLIELKNGTLTAGSFLNGAKPTGTLVNTGSATYSQTGGTASLGHVTGIGSMAITAGTLNVGSLRQGTVNVSGGTVAVAANGTAAGTSIIDNLTVSGTGVLDLRDNDLVVNNGSYPTIHAQVLAGFGTNTAITSSTSTGAEILALFDNAQVGASDWNGLPIGANAVVGKYTYVGDANIDGQVTGDDYTVVDANLNTTPSVGLEWLSGDMNFDGSVTGDDYTVVDANLGLGVGNPLSPSSLSAVPEPASALALGGIIATLAARRRRRS